MSSVALSPPRALSSTSPRVLLVIPGEESQSGSSMIFARRQAAKVAELGADVRVFYLRSRTSPTALYHEFRRFRACVREHRPEVIHAHFGTVTGMFAVIASGRIPVVITYRGSDLNPPPRASLRSWVGRLLSHCSAPLASSIVCVSQQLKQRLRWAKGRASVVPSGVDTDLFVPVARHVARRKLGWPELDRVVLFNAGHDPINKRLDLAQATVESARKVIPELRLEIMAGRTEPNAVPLLMSAADCLLVTSDSEGSPTVVQEALATNLPVVSVDVGDVPERLEGIMHTRVVARDPVRLAAAVVELVREPLRTNGRDRAQQLSAQIIAEELCRLYRRVRKN